MTSLLTARDVADRLGVSPETILRWSRRGEIPSLRLPGGAVRFREDELEWWLEERRRPDEKVLAVTPGAAVGDGTLPVLAVTEDEEDR